MSVTTLIPILISLAALAAPPAKHAPKPPPTKVAAPKPATSETKTPPPTLNAGLEVTVEDYDVKSDTFALELNATPGIGPNFVTPENLRQGIAYPGDQESFMKQKSQMIGSIYQLKNATPLVRDEDMPKREQRRPAP